MGDEQGVAGTPTGPPPPPCVSLSPRQSYGGPRGLMDKASDFGSED